MHEVNTVAALRERLHRWRARGERIAFVPTMGNLHDGHMTLIERARANADSLVASVYVNPLQFGGGEDFDGYPRTLEADRAMLAGASCDLLFFPRDEEIYPLGQSLATRIDLPGLTEMLCGEHRPGHFVGVATVVCKLLNMVQPDVAVFGEKDLQQLRIIQRLVADLYIPTRVLPAPTARESDGLAMSSRNRYLTTQERALAPVLYQTLVGARQALEAGDRAYAAIEARATQALRDAGLRPDYVSIRRGIDLQPPAARGEVELAVLGAAWLGRARLIDNLQLRLSPAG
ncbi:MAG: pantoate--beta-alanine ligase [Pseudomonadota bacterium]